MEDANTPERAAATDTPDARAVRARREALGQPDSEQPIWALALSGGGIRSATFCLGLVRGLARNGLLKQMDYLSTVSGGGYLGASLGRLYGSSPCASAVEQGVARDDSLWLWWLRNNGRYLTPSGAKDLGFASASILRGVISTHLEIGILITLLAAVVLLPHIVHSLLVLTLPVAKEQVSWLAMLPSAWTWLLVVPVSFCVYQIVCYWCIGKRHRRTISEQRLLRTKRLAYGLWGMVAVLAMMCLDLASWHIAAVREEFLDNLLMKLGPAVALVAAVGRQILPHLQRWLAVRKKSGINLMRALNILGLLSSAGVAVFWTTLLTVLAFPDAHCHCYWAAQWSADRTWAPLIFVAVVIGCAFYVLATRNCFDLLNLASLHNYYRARLERAYISSGNCGGDRRRFKGWTLGRVTRHKTRRLGPLTEAMKGDDVKLSAYAPHLKGGPIHLINCCVNQTVDDRTGLYNADRKGVALTVSALGVETGTHLPPTGNRGVSHLGTLSKWIAISGAAAGTGMGSQTAPGLAALLFMTGVRLGYWSTNLLHKSKASVAGTVKSLWYRLPKPLAIVAESLARFPGLAAPHWYISDGGHFDNTGIYAMLKRAPRLIIAADCGADPKYLFGDVESMVRKAKIDYGATITFLGEAELEGSPLRGIVATPGTIGPEPGPQWLLIGKITYADGARAALLVVKPRRLKSMPLEVAGYAQRNEHFPQQTTGDQFFDEAQWEAYHQLGLQMGTQLTPAIVDHACWLGTRPD